MSSADSDTPKPKGSAAEAKGSAAEKAGKGWDDEPAGPEEKDAKLETESSKPVDDGESEDEEASEQDAERRAEKKETKAPAEDRSRVTKRPRTKGRRIWPWVLVALVALVLLFVARTGSRILFEQDLELTSVSVAREVVPGGQLPLTFHFHAKHALDADDWIFVHIESESGGPNQCRLVHDLVPTPRPTQWGDQDVVHTIQIPVAANCKPGRLEIYAGLYNRQTWARLKPLDPRTPDNRVHAGWISIVSDDPDNSQRTITPREMRMQEYWALLRPWVPWGLGVAAAGFAAAWIHARRRDEDDEEDETSRRAVLSTRTRRIALAALAVPFFLGILVVLEFVKDDAYISFRYAHNLVTGHGLVFNPGERLEGFTNFLWVFILAPFEALGWDLFQVCEVLGTILGIIALVVTARFTSWINGERKDFSHLWGAFWLATSSSFVLWVKSGLEQPLASLLPIAGAFVLWRARDRFAHAPDESERKTLDKRYLYAGLMMGAGCMTRPELHLLAILVGLPLVLDAIRARTITRAQWLYVAGILAVTVPCHAFRYFYYGTLVPNTFYVKTGTGAMVWREGIRTLHDMFDFNYTGALAVLAPLAFANRRRLVEKATMMLIAIAFMVYYVKVGVDEMQWHRLYLPALPFLCVLAALGAQNLCEGALRVLKATSETSLARNVAYGLGWGAVILAGWNSFQFTYREQHGFDGHGDLAGTFHPDLGKFLVRHERPGALVAFQDMGSTPYHAPDINFLDFIGLVDRTVAHARHDFGLHAFVGSADDGTNQSKYDAQMREYFFQRNPEWAILTIYTPRGDEQRLAAEWQKDPTGATLGDAYRNNPFQFGLWDDPRFHQKYVAVRTWQRSLGYYLALWRRRDLWDQTPREVVIDAVPADAGGVKAKFEGGLELLGSDLTKQTLERHEAFITTWWKLPGPMPHDIMFFVHVTAPGFQAPGDHIPGDWMYPGDRWHAGEILEDRTLFQLPPFTMKPGTYSVYLGAYRMSTGERLKVVEGPNDGQDRVLLGTFDVKTLYPLIHQLIPPTRVDIMRKYPDRIVDAHRQPGT